MLTCILDEFLLFKTIENFSEHIIRMFSFIDWWFLIAAFLLFLELILLVNTILLILNPKLMI